MCRVNRSTLKSLDVVIFKSTTDYSGQIVCVGTGHRKNMCRVNRGTLKRLDVVIFKSTTDYSGQIV